MSEQKYLNRQDCLDIILDLAKSQGFYGRYYKELMQIKEGSQEAYEEIVKDWENQHFKDSVDFILYLEQ